MSEPSRQPPDAPEGVAVEPDSGAADALESVVDDTGPEVARRPAVEWAERVLIEGRSFESVSAELVDQGWEPAAAESIVEEAREGTRRARGLRTRDDVIRTADRHFKQSFRRVRLLMVLVVAGALVLWWLVFGRS